ncbi:aspartyl/asparaginyl beta-hydroxylase domain-containing protein [Polluticoccus soli]|uniref:aspartyl/asparaginyl beta-hydroxylase domain-containing protein n=1 Tax=Polluticoccus soli TaxID=3034150 RepID=UPI0023E28BF6|nr:aspartyl/asparaginyl beta-hydroxylase domain-containing protein [Flavipsychrobacter sp. JY13-12]
MIDKVLLPLRFDATRLHAEVLSFPEEDWIPHFNTPYYSGDWSAIPLRSVDGDPKRIFPDPTGKGIYQDTAHLLRCSYIHNAVSSLECEKIDVRLLRLKAGSSIKEHRDYDLAFEDGEVRLHIPVMTNPALEFYLNKELVTMREGECWYLNFNLPHSVSNRGTTDRVHLVVDCKINEWLSELFASATTVV